MNPLNMSLCHILLVVEWLCKYTGMTIWFRADLRVVSTKKVPLYSLPEIEYNMANGYNNVTDQHVRYYGSRISPQI